MTPSSAEAGGTRSLVEKLARTFAEEYLTGHYRPLRESERKKFEQLVVVMLAFAAQIQRVTQTSLLPTPPSSEPTQ